MDQNTEPHLELTYTSALNPPTAVLEFTGQTSAMTQSRMIMAFGCGLRIL
jgi:hypothetical protein